MTINEKSRRSMLIACVLVGAFLLAWLFELGCMFAESKIYKHDYSEFVEEYAEEYNIPSYVVYSVIYVESSFDANASSGEACGLMQLTPDTFRWISSNAHLGENLPDSAIYDPKTNIRYGCYYLRYLLDRFPIRDTALAAYNAGEGTVRDWLDDPEYTAGNGKLKKIPYKETKNYVKKVNDAIEHYKDSEV